MNTVHPETLDLLRYAIAKQSSCPTAIDTQYGEIDLFDVFDDEHLRLFREFLDALLRKQLSVFERGES